MELKFDIINLSINVEHIFEDISLKQWYLQNSKIDKDKSFNELTDDEKKRLIKLCLYEGQLDIEELCNLPEKQFKINA